jgi:hypothetical protein
VRRLLTHIKEDDGSTAAPPRVAHLGITSRTLDKAWWNELYQGYPLQDDYAAQSNVTLADHLKGHLLIEHGDIEDKCIQLKPCPWLTL